MTTSTLTPARKARSYLPPNLYSGAFLLSELLTLDKKSFMLIEGTKSDRARIYTRIGRFYTAPRVDELPAQGYDWQFIGRLRSRDLYVANLCSVQ